MQAIVTKILPATNFKPTRIKAFCARGSLIASHPIELSGEDAHRLIAERLTTKFAAEDKAKYGTPLSKNPWGHRRVIGQLPNGDFAHVFID